MNKLILLALLFSTPLLAETDSAIPVEETVSRDELLSAPSEIKNSEAQDSAPVETRTELATEGIYSSPVESPKKEETYRENRDVPVLTTEVPYDERKLEHFKSHWVTTYGFEGMKYDTPYNFNGVRNHFGPSSQELWGGRIGFGKQMYLGKGFFTTTKGETFYMGTLFARSLRAGPQNEEEAASIKRTGQIYGVDFSQNFGYIFEMKTKNPVLDEMTYLTVEPFIEAGVGWAQAYQRLAYHWDTGDDGAATTLVQEDFRKRVRDQLTNVHYGAGVNFTANTGFFLYLRATVNNFNITKRNTQTYQKFDGQNGATTRGSESNVKMDSIMVYALGGGYKF